jgi:hypothetical protein
MSIEKAIDEWIAVMIEAGSIRSAKDAKEISKRSMTIS